MSNIALRAVLNCIGGGNVEVYWAGRVTVDAPIAITEGNFLSVTGEDSLAEVHGDDSVINNRARLFDVSQGGGLTLTGIKLTGGYAAEGGAIYSRAANLTLDNCVFEGNVAKDGNGGAVWADGETFTIVGGNFSGNNASRYGGAVHAANGKLVVKGGSRFEGNRAMGGGALFCGVGEVGPATPETVCSITAAEFVSNSAAHEGDDHVSGLLRLDGGGAAMFVDARVDVTDSTFSGNYALLSGEGLSGSYDTHTLVYGSKLGSTTPEKYGGAIAASSMAFGGETQFTNNSALADGGLTALKLTEYYAADGGAIYSHAANLTLKNCVFEGNVAKDGGGGAVWASDGDFTIVGGQFSGNNASRYGGAVHAFNGKLLVKGGSRFEGNTAIGGGALFCGLCEVGEATSDPVCSIIDGEFVSNRADRGSQDDVDDLPEIDAGGAALFLFVSADITDSTFSGNYALLSGGASHGGLATTISVNACTFGNNTSGNHGGAITASSTTLGGGSQFTNNSALEDGGAVLGWDANGTIVFNDVLCTKNSAATYGGCFYAFGGGIINDGTEMLDNSADRGGSIVADEGSHILVNGGTFTSRLSTRGGFIFAKGNNRVEITGGLIVDNVVSRRGGALYCDGTVPCNVSIEGGTFKNNHALEAGGVIAAWGDRSLVTITGGTFEDNFATLYGGFAFIETGVSLQCEGGTIRRNRAGDRGGGIYARDKTWVNSSCDLIENKSPEGASIYLTDVQNATFENHVVNQTVATQGSLVYVAESFVVARGVRFSSRDDVRGEFSFNRAIQLEGNATLYAEQCVFSGWLGDTVIFNTNSAEGSLVLDSCDFSGSSAAMAVMSPDSDARIRNAVVSNFTFATALSGTVQYPVRLVDRALKCGDPFACGRGGCVDSALGVLCECLEGGECIGDGGKLSLRLQTPPAVETFSPDPVKFRLLVSAGVGTTNSIWQLKDDVAGLDLQIIPSSGILPPNGTITVSVTGTSSRHNVGGNLVSRFDLMSPRNASSDSIVVSSLEFISTFYLCHDFQYADTVWDNDTMAVLCKQCMAIEGAEGVNCETPGLTLTSLPIQPGYWRSDNTSLVVHECLHFEACEGGKNASSTDNYCREGYRGPYCAVCAEGYGRGSSNACYYCDDSTAHVLIGMGTLFCILVIMLLPIAVVFLVGGLDAIDTVRQTLSRTLSKSANRTDSFKATAVPALDFVLTRNPCKIGPRLHSLDETTIPTFSLSSEVGHCGDEGGIPSRGTLSTNECGREVPDWVHAEPLGAVVGAPVDVSDTTSRYGGENAVVSSKPGDRISTVPGIAVNGSRETQSVNTEYTTSGRLRCCGFGDKVKRSVSRLPFDKLKILVVVWQILTVGSSVTGVEFPASYSWFLSWINIINLDIGNTFSASCVLSSVNFYVRLLVTTLSPLVLATVLVLTYHFAKARAGIGRAGVIARRAAWSRHVAAGLLLTFMVFTSTSTLVFKTFACDPDAIAGETYLREDYSLSCDTRLHMFFKIYSGIMILVYPIGIPVLYAAILWQNRALLNPRIDAKSGGVGDTATSAEPEIGDDTTRSMISTTSARMRYDYNSFQELQEVAGKVKARRNNPELVPSMFLWKDFGPDLYYYEVVECGRRMLLTGVLIFIAPHTASQATIACIFAFASLVGFELMRPHMDPADSWLYRLGCVVIFLSNFLALLVKVDAGREADRAVFGGLLVAINVLLVLAVIMTSWFAVQQSVDESSGEDNSLTIARAMLTAEQYAADSAHLTREGRPQMPAAFFSVERDVSSFGGTSVKNDSPPSHERYATGATNMATNDCSVSSGARGGEINAAVLERSQHHRHTPGAPGSEKC